MAKCMRICVASVWAHATQYNVGKHVEVNMGSGPKDSLYEHAGASSWCSLGTPIPQDAGGGMLHDNASAGEVLGGDLGGC